MRVGEGESAACVAAADFVWLLGNLCRFHGVEFDHQRLRQQFPPPCARETIHEAARALGLETGELATTSFGPEVPLPAVAFLRAQDGGLKPAILARREDEQLAYLLPGEPEPALMPLAELAARVHPVLLLASRKAPGDRNIAGFAEEKRTFGFRWFVPELARHKEIWRDVLLVSLAIQLVGLGMPLGTQVIVDKVVTHQTQSTLVAIAIGLAMFLLFNAGMTWMRQYLLIHTGNRVDAVLAAEVFRHLFRLPVPYFEHRPTGVTVARLHGVETIREFITGASVSLMLDLPFLVIVLGIMFWYSWQLTLIALGVVTLLAALSVLVTPVLRDRLNRQFMLGARNQAFLTEYVSGVETVKSLQFEPVLERRYGDYLASYLAASFGTRQLANSYNVIANALEQIMTLAILVMGALLVMRGDGFTIGMLVAFQMFAARMSQPMLRIAGLWQEFQQANIAVQRLGDILDAPAEPHSLAPDAAADGAGRIELQGLSFRYGEKHPWLFRDLSAAIRPGTLLVVAGPSGCGKSTLAKLLLGFYQPGDGRILLDGRDLQGLPANEIRRAFGVVPQETTLYSGTVYDNLAMANPHAGFEDVVAACRQAEIHDTIEKLPEGYRTVVGEHGVGLSGGQKQRIAIARALLKRPRILIFDESTSNLDSRTAENLAQTVTRLKGAATIIFISHTVPRGLEADQVLRFGPHEVPRSDGKTADA